MSDVLMPLHATVAETTHIRQRFADVMSSLAMGMMHDLPNLDVSIVGHELAHAAYLFGVRHMGMEPSAEPTPLYSDADDALADDVPDVELAKGTGVTENVASMEDIARKHGRGI